MTSRAMRYPRRWINLLAVLLGLVITPPLMAQQNDPVGVVATLRGNADAIREGRPTVALAVQDSVLRKDVLVTRAQSLLEVAFDDGSTFTLAENSRVEIAEFAPGTEPQGLLSLIRGRLRSTISSVFSSREDSYQVQTSEGVMGVQGTEFDVLALPLETRVYVYSGIVSVRHRDAAFPGTRRLYAGQTVTISAGQPVPEPTQFLPGDSAGLGSGGRQALRAGPSQLNDPYAVLPGVPDITDNGSRVPPVPNPPGK